jgi:hypothetical protein
MAKVICCRDVGVDRDFRASGETVEKVLRACNTPRTRMVWTRFHPSWME